MINLTKNEKTVLKILMQNARTSDSKIAKKLKITSQAIGKIRKKLESSIIDSYTPNINYSKLGINVFAISHSKLTLEGLEKGELEIEQTLLREANIIQVYRVPTGSITHIIFYGFKDLEELDNFFHSQLNNKHIHKYLQNIQLFTFSNHSLIKNNPMQLFEKMINEIDNKNQITQFHEIKNFKKKLR